jgi:hypothetical protein
MTRRYIPLSVLIVAAASHAPAAVSVAEAQRLSGPLTPLGAERSGDPALGIPDWTGGYAGAAQAAPAAGARPDPYPADRPLFAITAANLKDYADRLPEGQKALFQKYPDYRMDIYAARRTAAAPQSVYDATLANATRAHAASGGLAFGISGAAGGIPFPIPQSGAEIVWNHLLAFWGPARDDRLATWFIPAGGVPEMTNHYREIVDFPYYYKGAAPDSIGGYYFKRREISDGPAALAGRGYIDWRPLDGGAQSFRIWQYLPGQRRVRTAPALAYDTPTPDGAGIESFDDYYIFSGGPDRYAFTLLGKKPMYIPYNNNRFHALPIRDVTGPFHANPDALRYELHRVWVVDATLAPGQHHLAPHRRLYFDEDTWLAVYADAWDADGKLWKFSEATMYLMADLPAVVLGSDFIYDLQNGGYVLAFAFNGEPAPLTPTAPHAPSIFEPETLAAEGVR